MVTANLLDTLATSESPRLDFTPRPGTLDVATITAAVSAWCTGKSLSADRQALLLALALLYHDHEPEAHALCQANEGQSDADLIHAILHRREGDAANAGYWWRAVGDHPVFPALAAAAARFQVPAGEGHFDPQAVVAAVMAKADVSRLRAYQMEEFHVVAAHLGR